MVGQTSCLPERDSTFSLAERHKLSAAERRNNNSRGRSALARKATVWKRNNVKPRSGGTNSFRRFKMRLAVILTILASFVTASAGQPGDTTNKPPALTAEAEAFVN